MNFYIQRTKTTPYALINNGYMKIAGKSVPVEEKNFFGVFNEQINRYIKKPNNKTSLDFSLSHVNASSKRQIIGVLNQLESLISLGFDVEVNWYYEEDNEDVREFGEILDNMFTVTVNLIGNMDAS